MILLLFILSGPVGEYLGLDYHFFTYSQGFDSLHTLTSDSGDITITDTFSVLDTLTYQGHPAYLTRRVRISDLSPRADTTLSWEIGDSLFTYTVLGETVQVKSYVIPFTVGSRWDLGLVGDTLIGDFDNDGIDDTLIVEQSSALVSDSLPISVPLGTFYAFQLDLTIFLRGWQSYISDSCRLWIRDLQHLVPYLGVIRDSTVIIDTVRLFNIWVWAATMILYTEAVDTGYIGIREAETSQLPLLYPILGGVRIHGSGSWMVEVYDVAGRCCEERKVRIDQSGEFRPPLPSGIYFARIRGKKGIRSIKFLVLK
ncbi:hypothetical protein DRP53_00665 [candidate division WOR-3 bacterium]|uniref:Secretion system C-terminal sorting domain-containing protein n=1 Tax=candidate division WOR-3 bacterium TaxID=2052148 RepID=A0A660SP31_UNCW3|nr:MAG: hypothetical protein DRP53_00665 [candidate division WOR-3 bacterium]